MEAERNKIYIQDKVTDFEKMDFTMKPSPGKNMMQVFIIQIFKKEHSEGWKSSKMCTQGSFHMNK